MQQTPDITDLNQAYEELSKRSSEYDQSLSKELQAKIAYEEAKNSIIVNRFPDVAEKRITRSLLDLEIDSKTCVQKIMYEEACFNSKHCKLAYDMAREKINKIKIEIRGAN